MQGIILDSAPRAPRAVRFITILRHAMSVSSRSALALVLLFSGACASGSSSAGAGGSASRAEPVITTGDELLAAMHARYAGRWFTTLSFLQNNTLYSATGGEQKTQWLEHMSVPGKLRIDYIPLATHSGVMYEGGRVHVFDNGRRVQSQPGVNPLLLLGFDVYAQPVAATAKTLDSLGFELGVMHH